MKLSIIIGYYRKHDIIYYIISQYHIRVFVCGIKSVDGRFGYRLDNEHHSLYSDEEMLLLFMH